MRKQALGWCISGLMLLLLSSCFKNFNDLRENPEGVDVDKAVPSTFLSNALYNAVTTGVYRGHTVNDQLVQVSVATSDEQFDVHRYQFYPYIYDYMWGSMYGPAKNIDQMIKAAKATGDHNYEAIGYTLHAWIFSCITDIYGDVPFTQALKGDDNYQINPPFDPQQQIYDSLLVYLDRANNLYDPAKGLSGEDLLFNATDKANIVKWKRFANSLRLRLLMRVEKKSAAYRDMLKAMLDDPASYPLMTSNADNACLVYTNVIPNMNPFYNEATRYNSKIYLSQYFVNTLSDNNDPRLAAWASTSGGANQYRGVPSGYPAADINYYSGYSTYIASLKTSNYFGSIMQYAEVEFLLAEACLKGYMAGDAAAHYANGVKASMDYWKVAMPADFLSHPGVAYDGTLERIITQKYFALFTNDYQQWHEYRRTGYPVLPRGQEVDNNGVMPSRLPYPTNIRVYNKTNYNAAVERQGPDDINTKVWWAKP